MSSYEAAGKRQTIYSPYQDSSQIQEELGNMSKSAKTPEMEIMVGIISDNLKRQEEVIQNLVQKLHTVIDPRETTEKRGEDRIRVDRVTVLGKKLDGIAAQMERITETIIELTRRLEV